LFQPPRALFVKHGAHIKAVAYHLRPGFHHDNAAFRQNSKVTVQLAPFDSLAGGGEREAQQVRQDWHRQELAGPEYSIAQDADQFVKCRLVNNMLFSIISSSYWCNRDLFSNCH